MKKLFFVLSIIITGSQIAYGQAGFDGAIGSMVQMGSPDLSTINDELIGLDMPELDGLMVIFGGSGWVHINKRLRIGGLGFSGNIHSSDVENGYARDVCFRLSGGGMLVEAIIWEGHHLEFYGGGVLGWGEAKIKLQKTEDPATWEGVWGGMEPGPTPEDNISTDLEHNFFLVQPRIGLIYYLTSWLALNGTVDLPIIHLNSGGWKVNGKDLYNAPSMDITQPFFSLGLLIGG